jgi:hypothetical protein
MLMKHRPLEYLVFGAKAQALAGVLAILWAAPMPTRAQGTVWNGPLTTFTEPAGDTGTLPGDQDRITADVWLTRSNAMGLFNAALETGYTHSFSPSNTVWAFGTLDQYASLTYTNWEDLTGGNPPSMVGVPAVLYLISDNIYIGIEFSSWGMRGVGGFSYNRTTADVPEASSGLLMAAGLVGLSAHGWRVRRGRGPDPPARRAFRGLRN